MAVEMLKGSFQDSCKINVDFKRGKLHYKVTSLVKKEKKASDSEKSKEKLADKITQSSKELSKKSRDN